MSKLTIGSFDLLTYKGRVEGLLEREYTLSTSLTALTTSSNLHLSHFFLLLPTTINNNVRRTVMCRWYFLLKDRRLSFLLLFSLFYFIFFSFWFCLLQYWSMTLLIKGLICCSLFDDKRQEWNEKKKQHTCFWAGKKIIYRERGIKKINKRKNSWNAVCFPVALFVFFRRLLRLYVRIFLYFLFLLLFAKDKYI